jgi:hypothetical protein
MRNLFLNKPKGFSNGFTTEHGFMMLHGRPILDIVGDDDVS